MRSSYGFVNSVFMREFPRSHKSNIEGLPCRCQGTPIAVRRSASMCKEENNTGNSVPRHVGQPEELNTAQSFIEPKAKKRELQNTEFAFILTSLVTAVAGGPIITAWSALYFFLGRENDVPLWLCSLASLMSSALTDAFIWNFSNSHQNTGFIPYLLFVSGTAVSAVFDFDEFFRIAIPSGSQRNKLKKSDISPESGHRKQPSRTVNDLNAWDESFKEKLNDQE